ncbi:MAG: YcgN family cysteine cluster protein [Geminicoccaceae bacterium]|nr:YcgN family cysteine cluster protein [Geminicoccaceae bacterium]
MAGCFWEDKRLEEMTHDEWERVCDGCAKCCLVKLEDEDTAEVFYTDLHCRMLNENTCRCTAYDRRAKEVPSCVILGPESIDDLWMMPTSCAYRRLHEGRGLPAWHHLISKDASLVLKAGKSIRGRSFAENAIGEEEFEDRLVDWPVLEGD